MTKLILKVFMLIILIYLATAGQAAIASPFASSNAWLKLLHYQHKWTGGYKSKVVGHRFFFAPDGRTDPQAELTANLLAARTRTDEYSCRFPARFRFLKSRFDLPTPTKPCPDLERWLRKFHADSVSVVFSSPYFSNPSSALGHTFLRFNSVGGNRLTDTAVGYAADMPPNVGAFSYIYNGLMGGFHGAVFFDPYFAKVHEYNLIDNRDLWEYKLNFSPDEVRMLLEHVWEYSLNGEQYYYFLDEYCSLLILDLLNAVRPDVELGHGLHLYVLPIQTIRNLNRIGWISSYSFYPSQRRVFWADLDALSSNERTQFDQELFPANPKVLNAEIDYFAFKKVDNSSHQLSAKDEATYRSALIARAKLKTTPEEDAPAPMQTPPPAHLGHDPHHISIGGGDSTGGAFEDLTLYPSVHESIDPENGYVPLSEVTVMAARLRYYSERNTLVPESIRLIDISTHVPYAKIDPLPSWHASLELGSREAEGCYRCVRGSANFAYGAGTQLFTKDLYGYVMGGSTLENGFAFSPPLRFLMGPETGIFLTPGDRFKLTSSFKYQWTVIPMGLPLNRAVTGASAGFLVTNWLEIVAHGDWSLTHLNGAFIWQEASLGTKIFF